jgi:hypothetical protein
MIYFPYELAKLYEQERIEEAEHCWQIKQIKAGKLKLTDHLFSNIHHILMCSGRKLKKQGGRVLAALTKVEVRFEGWLRNRWIH